MSEPTTIDAASEPTTINATSEPLLQVRDLATHFATRAGTARAVDGVSFDVYAGEIVGLVGESGTPPWKRRGSTKVSSSSNR